MAKDGSNSAIVKSIVLVVLGGIVILGLYLMFTRGKPAAKDEEYKLTAVDEITTTELDKNYPADPRMVVELYSKTMRILYRETYTDEQRKKMLNVLAGIMDDELLANQSNFERSMISEIDQKKKEDYSIPSYAVDNKEPEGVKVDGRKMCTVECLFSIRKGTKGTTARYQFILRQDDAGKWKILGWTVADE